MLSPVLIGWLCELGAWLFFGSFNVPVKHPSVLPLRVDPLVFQSWKTACMFTTSWIVLAWRPFYFSLWGLCSGAFWVVGGAFAILAFQFGGVAVGAGTLNSMIVIVSFTWALAVFHQPVYSLWITLLCVAALLVGILGMVYALRPVAAAAPAASQSSQVRLEAPVEDEAVLLLDPSKKDGGDDDHVRIGALRVPRYWFGIACAVIAGLTAGSSLAPLRFGGVQGGIGYLVSFAIGSLTVNTVLWIAYVVVRLITGRPAFPEFHWRKMLVPGLLTGLLWSAGNFCSMYAIIYLGMIGNGCAQLSILVSGIWGIALYKEARGGLRIFLWAVSALLAVGAIIGLSFMQSLAVVSSCNVTESNCTAAIA